MFDPSEDLLERLRSVDVHDADVMEFLWGQHNWLHDNHKDSPPVSMFFHEGQDLAQYRMAQAWWPKHAELPAQFAFPTLYLLCWSYHEQDPRVGATFADRLTLKAQGVVSWMESAGIDPTAPNETPEERKVRLNAVAQKRHRARKGGDGHAVAVKAAYDVYMGVFAERKAAFDSFRPRIDAAKAAWEALKNNPPS